MSKKEKFTIPQIEEEVTKKERQTSKYVSPYSGTSAKDDNVFPYVQYGNQGKQYQGLNGEKGNTDDKEELRVIYSDDKVMEEEKKRRDQDKYSPDRIPTYYRKEDVSGIDRGSIADLKGEKLSEEEIIERNRRQYGQMYQNVMAEQNNRTKPRQEEVINDPLNTVNNPKYNDEKTYDVDSIDEYNEEVEINNNNVNYNSNVNRNSINNNYETINYKEDDYNLDDENIDNNYGENRTKTNQNLEFIHVDNTPKNEESYRKPNVVTDDLGNVTHTNNPRINPHNPGRDGNVDTTKIKFGNKKIKYTAPPLDILRRNGGNNNGDNSGINYKISAINSTLDAFKVAGKVIKYTRGPTVTQFEVKLDPGVNVSKVTGIAKNLQMTLESEEIRIQAPIPCSSTVGIEVPNEKKDLVLFGDLVSKESFLKDNKPLNVVLGLSISGEHISANISDMPHCLVAGYTGGGKSYCLYSIITSILYKASPEEVKLILIDPKGNELIYFEDVPHLATPIIDDPKLATASLNWAVEEMARRYDFLKANRKRTIGDYNAYATANGLKIIPYIVIIIDEFADLMSTASESFEKNVQRLTQKARSAGVHLIIATQRPTTDVIKGTIKANIPSRIAVKVQSPVDSLTILDHVGAEKLLGKGDMLFAHGPSDIRVQGAFISEAELEILATYFAEQNVAPDYIFTHDEIRATAEEHENGNNDGFSDEYLEQIAHFVFRQRKASANQIQTNYEIGFNRANKIITALAALGIVSSENIPGKARDVIINDIDELEEILRNR